MHSLYLLVPLFDIWKIWKRACRPSCTYTIDLRNWIVSNFLLCPLSSITGAIELPYDFEFTSEFAMLINDFEFTSEFAMLTFNV